jgi:hypothetical protein
MANELMEQPEGGLQEYQPQDVGVATYNDFVMAETFPSTYESTELQTIDSQDRYQDVGELAPYKFWDNKSKQIFRSAPEEIQRAWIATQKKSDARAYKTTEQIKELYEPFNALAEVLAPYVNDILATGMTIPEYLHRTIEADKKLTANPLEFICGLMDAKDIYTQDIDDAFQGFYKRRALEAQLNPIKQEVSKLKSELEHKEAATEQKKYDDMVTQFYSQKDSRGNLLYPHAPELSNVIVSLIESTGETDLDKLYNMAYSAAVAKQQGDERSSESGFALSDQESYVEPQSPARNEKEEDRRYYKNLARNIAAKYGLKN